MTFPRVTTTRLFQSPPLWGVDDAAQPSGPYARARTTRKKFEWPNTDGNRKCAHFLGGC
jgi:hypothetical protein